MTHGRSPLAVMMAVKAMMQTSTMMIGAQSLTATPYDARVAFAAGLLGVPLGKPSS